MSEFAFSIHGHFYQPAREDPVTGLIPNEAGAVPYKNWNELIYSHCYKPNAELGNFKRISFNFGPTLLNWMGQYYPDTLQSIIAQDRHNYDQYGVGNAMAQPYHHTILPLANYQDKVTQVRWGLADFEYRFGHKATGMWLPETAVDLETLEVLVEHGIEYTILAPWQAKTDHLDITQPYWVNLPNRQRIAIFFYHQSLSTQVSFDPLSTVNADRFAAEFISPLFKDDSINSHPKFVLIASDGELYGHHQPFRDKFLAHLMNGVLTNRSIAHMYPALWLRKHPPTETIEIHEATSWSCHHGVKRWSSVCDCTPNSQWKENLRQAMEEVANEVDQVFQAIMSDYTEKIWDLRHDYIDMMLGLVNEDEYIEKKIGHPLLKNEMRQIKFLLRAQVERQRMFTSCGWFFEDFDRIEPQNVVAYAAQAIYWTELASGIPLSEKLLPIFDRVKSWRNGMNGKDVFLRQLANAHQAYQQEDLNLQTPA